MKSSTSYTTLSSQTNLPERTLRLLLRQSFLNGIFYEPEPDRVAHTASSAALVTNAPFYDWFGHSVEEVFPASAKLAEALERCSQGGIGDLRAEDSAFSLAVGGGESVFEFFEKRPDKQRRFRGAMEAVGMDGAHDLGFVVGGLDWGKVGRGVVVDVGHFSSFSFSSLEYQIKETNGDYIAYR